MKFLLSSLVILFCSSVYAAPDDSSVLLAPIDASRVGSYDWGVVILNDPIPSGGSTADRGSLKVNLDLAKFFQEGFAIYSITKLEKKDQATPALLLVLVRPKTKGA